MSPQPYPQPESLKDISPDPAKYKPEPQAIDFNPANTRKTGQDAGVRLRLLTFPKQAFSGIKMCDLQRPFIRPAGLQGGLGDWGNMVFVKIIQRRQ
jgi:hypothetical protein